MGCRWVQLADKIPQGELQDKQLNYSRKTGSLVAPVWSWTWNFKKPPFTTGKYDEIWENCPYDLGFAPRLSWEHLAQPEVLVSERSQDPEKPHDFSHLPGTGCHRCCQLRKFHSWWEIQCQLRQAKTEIENPALELKSVNSHKMGGFSLHPHIIYIYIP